MKAVATVEEQQHPLQTSLLSLQHSQGRSDSVESQRARTTERTHNGRDTQLNPLTAFQGME